MSLAVDADYWTSRDGITARLDMLGETVVWDYFNNAVKVSANAFGITKLKIVGPFVDACEYCQGLFDENGVGREYMIYWFLPDLPAHNGCRHFWDMMIPDVSTPY